MLAWSALEVLSPQSFLKPEDLASGDIQRISRFVDQGLPWEKGGERSRPNYRLYYQIVLGTIQMEPAVAELLTVYTDKRDERPPARGESIIATVIVDRQGRLADSDAVAVSSFAWGVPIALGGDLKALGDWQTAEADLLENLDQRLRRHDDEGQLIPLTSADIDGAYKWLVDRIGIAESMTKPPSFAVKSYQWFKIDEPPEALLLNSFFLADLDKARNLFKAGRATSNLKRYVGLTPPDRRDDLLRDADAIARALHPPKMPLGRWPGKGRHPLVALQQAAVNLASHDLGTDGILAVNGPPGTGKTTLLRDVVAHVVTERAKVMAGFDDPETAFKNTNQRIKKGNAFLWMYELDDRLRGFEIIVASSNNKAVENVSAELPGIKAIADDAFPKGYFKTVSDALLERDTWGLIAAVLGNASNRSRFRQQFWWDDDTGLSRYLQHAAGTPKLITIESEDGQKHERPPHIVKNENPPSDKVQAISRWKSAGRKFLDAEKQAQTIIKDAARAAELPAIIAAARSELDVHTTEETKVRETFAALQQMVRARQQDLAKANDASNAADLALNDIRKSKPGLLVWLFRRRTYRTWKERHDLASRAAREASLDRQRCRDHFEEASRQHIQTGKTLSWLHETIKRLRTQINSAKEELSRLKSSLGGVFIDDAYFEYSHRERQLASPWLDQASSRARDLVFEAAVELHKAFIDAAAKPLRHNLGLLMDSFGVRSFGTPEKDAVIPHLWSSLFIVVPAVSTTFASVGRMHGRLEPDSLGWLLIDEAGQALPQAAVGAIMRCKRAVVVGDPLQIEPVVVLPDQLTEAICKEFKVDETRFNAPAASAQTLADSATSYFSSFETKTGSRDVGVPLLVHRRCADPMFSISNAIAYENLMVQAKAPKPSSIKETLGPSRWINVAGGGQDKWCPEEGDVVLDLLRKLRDAGVSSDLYIVTPFVVVQDRLRESIRRSRLLEDWVDSPSRWPYDRVGTVHTVQGREAEAVILVLGAPLARQTGARSWAGRTPNLLNVAVSRAQEALYVIGNRQLWEGAGVFSELASRL